MCVCLCVRSYACVGVHVVNEHERTMAFVVMWFITWQTDIHRTHSVTVLQLGAPRLVFIFVPPHKLTKSRVFRGPHKPRLILSKTLQKPRLVFSMTLNNLFPIYFPVSAVLHVSCSFLFLSSSNIFALFSPDSACTRLHPEELWRQLSLSPRFLLKWTFEYSAVFKSAFRPTWCDIWKLKDSQTGSHHGRDDPKRCNQIMIMPFIQTSLAQIKSARS
jgi:hypothetical protein